VFVDLGVRYAGYHADFNRCLVVGQATSAQQDLQERVRLVSEEAARYVVPGAATREVYARVLDDCRRAGLTIDAPGRIGHGIGLGVTEPPHISAEDTTILQAGMVVTIEPAVERDDGLYCAECLYVAAPDGGRRLNPAPSPLLSTGRP
jgi:Xaa-Pro dipeptidase